MMNICLLIGTESAHAVPVVCSLGMASMLTKCSGIVQQLSYDSFFGIVIDFLLFAPIILLVLSAHGFTRGMNFHVTEDS